jgi:hypothetical protein
MNDLFRKALFQEIPGWFNDLQTPEYTSYIISGKYK